MRDGVRPEMQDDPARGCKRAGGPIEGVVTTLPPGTDAVLGDVCRLTSDAWRPLRPLGAGDATGTRDARDGTWARDATGALDRAHLPVTSEPQHQRTVTGAVKRPPPTHTEEPSTRVLRSHTREKTRIVVPVPDLEEQHLAKRACIACVELFFGHTQQRR